MILRQISNEIGLYPINTILPASVGTVPANTLTTILTLTAVAKHKIVKISCSGEDYAKFQLFIDTDLVETRRSGPERTIEFSFPTPLLLQPGQILDVKVTHFYTGATPTFESTLYSIV